MIETSGGLGQGRPTPNCRDVGGEGEREDEEEESRDVLYFKIFLSIFACVFC